MQNSAEVRCHFNVIWPYESEGLANGVVERGADLLDGLILTVGPGAVGQQDNSNGGIEVYPKRTAAVAEVANRAG